MENIEPTRIEDIELLPNSLYLTKMSLFKGNPFHTVYVFVDSLGKIRKYLNFNFSKINQVHYAAHPFEWNPTIVSYHRIFLPDDLDEIEPGEGHSYVVSDLKIRVTALKNTLDNERWESEETIKNIKAENRRLANLVKRQSEEILKLKGDPNV